MLRALAAVALLSALLWGPDGARLRAQDVPVEDTLEIPVAVPDSIPDFSSDDPSNGEASDSTAPATIVFDSSEVAIRYPSDSTMKRLRADDDFVYDREQKEPDSLWDRFLRWLRKSINTLLGGDGAENTVVEWLCYILAAAVVVFVVLKLMGSDIRSLFLRGSRARVSPFAELDENIHEMNFDAMIDEAVAARQYRRAVRLIYLKGLKALADKGAIDWRKDKTNRDYLHELRESPLRAPFADATLVFEYVWYGDMPINESIFRSVRANLDGFVTTINSRS